MEYDEVDTNDELEELYMRLERMEQMVKENNKILRGMHRSAQMARLFQFLYLLVVILLFTVGVYLAWPYIMQLQELVEVYRSGFEGLQQ